MAPTPGPGPRGRSVSPAANRPGQFSRLAPSATAQGGDLALGCADRRSDKLERRGIGSRPRPVGLNRLFPTTPVSYRDTGSVTIPCENGVRGEPTSKTCYDGCAAETKSWSQGDHGCSASVSQGVHGAFKSVNDGTGSTHGSADFICSDGGWERQSGSTCGTTPSCPAVANQQWSDGGDNCAARLPAANSGSSSTATDSTYRDTGSVTIPCGNGVWGEPTSKTCYDGCAAETKSWSQGDHGCSASVSQGVHGAFKSVNDGTGSTHGSADFICSDGGWERQSGSTCGTARSCPAVANQQWSDGGDNCAARLPAANRGSSSTATDSSWRDTGSVTIPCENGVRGETTSKSCYDGCATELQAWSQGGHRCSVSVSQGVHGASRSVEDGSGSTRGSAEFVCSDGTWDLQLGSTCGVQPRCPAVENQQWSDGGDNCAARLPAANSGSSSTATDSSWRDTGSVTIPCENGVRGEPTSKSCYDGCTTGPQTWMQDGHRCSVSVSQGVHGASRSVEDGSGSTRGSAEFVCSDGTWDLQLGSTCGIPPSCPAVDGQQWSDGGDNCAARLPAAASGSSSTATDSSWRDTGSVTIPCENGVRGEPTSKTCYDGCTTGPQTWMQDGHRCSVSVSQGVHGASRSVEDGSGSTRGSAEFVCSDGTWDLQLGSTCGVPPSCPAVESQQWSVGGDNCAALRPAAASGSSSTATDSTYRDTGSATYPCNAGVWGSPTSKSCYRGCSGQTFTGCPLADTVHGAASGGTCGTGYSGTCSYSCNDGTWTPVEACQAVYLLRVSPRPENGYVTAPRGKGDGISCGYNNRTNCEEYYDANTLVTLSRSAKSRFVFKTWGKACTGKDGCTVEMDSNKTVSATFKSTLA